MTRSEIKQTKNKTPPLKGFTSHLNLNEQTDL